MSWNSGRLYSLCGHPPPLSLSRSSVSAVSSAKRRRKEGTAISLPLLFRVTKGMVGKREKRSKESLISYANLFQKKLGQRHDCRGFFHAPLITNIVLSLLMKCARIAASSCNAIRRYITCRCSCCARSHCEAGYGQAREYVIGSGAHVSLLDGRRMNRIAAAQPDFSPFAAASFSSFFQGDDMFSYFPFAPIFLFGKIQGDTSR